jgi:hypothetical protein
MRDRINYMENHSEGEHVPHKGRNTAYHVEWEFRREAAVWTRNHRSPLHPNFYPFATELKNWMLQEPFNVPVFSSDDQTYTNPYTNHASALANMFMFVVNDCGDFREQIGTLNPYEAECRRLRLYSENVLYAARVCESFIKQLLYCTTFDENSYRGAALGSLLSGDCNGCRTSKGKPHRLSLLGSLAHRYNLCHTYEGCLKQHIAMANRRRELEAAHSNVATFAPGSATRSKFEKEITKIGNDLVHMLSHISEIEMQMLIELDTSIKDMLFQSRPQPRTTKGSASGP